jgi:tetratricopeptide (TPR) repeat protein
VRPVTGPLVRVDDVGVVDEQQPESPPDTANVDRLPQSVQHQNRVLQAGHRGTDFTEKKECIKWQFLVKPRSRYPKPVPGGPSGGRERGRRAERFLPAFFPLAARAIHCIIPWGRPRETDDRPDSCMRYTNGLLQRPCASLLACVAVFSSLVTFSTRAQEALDPNDIWYRGFLLVQSAQDLEGKGKYLDALNKLNEAKPLYDHLAQQFPDFQPEIVRDRRHLIAEKRDELKVAMRAPKVPSVAVSPAAPAAPELPNATNPAQPLRISPPPVPGAEFDGPPVAVPVATNRTLEIEGEGEFALPSWDEGASQALPRADSAPGMPRVETRGGNTVGAIATSLDDDLSRKDALISWLNDENQKLRTRVKQHEQMLQSVNAELTRAHASRDELMRRIAAAEGGPGGVEAQKKIEQLKGLLKDATDQLHEATERNEQLVAAMEQSQQEMEKMRVRMGELERERDNLLEVVRGEGNGGKALKELMDRNRVLTEQLDRAEQLAASLSELNQEKDDDIALLKSEITRIKLERDQLLAENARHQQSIGELQEKLAMLSDGLTAEDKQALASATPVERQENELLRSIVLKQLRRQAQMKQAKELLLSQLDRVGARSDTLLGLVEDMARGSQLSEEEKALFKAPQFEEIIAAAGAAEAPALPATPDDGDSATNAGGGDAAVMSATLIAPGNGPSPAGVSPDGVIEKQKITVELAQIDKAARLDFKEGRYAEAESGFLEYLRYLPQNVPCLCNLGVLKISMKNYSEAEYYLEKALAIDGKSGLANYLLGRAYFLQDKLDEALAKLETGLTYDPQNAKAHNCVGVISTRKGWVTRAERAFTNAVSIDPEYGDAHFNLAVLYATREQPDANEAGKHYFRALHLGIPRDATIETFLKEAETAGAAVGMR